LFLVGTKVAVTRIANGSLMDGLEIRAGTHTLAMIARILVAMLYWFGGGLLALIGSVALGLAFCVVVAVLHIFRYKWAWVLLLGYSAGVVICLLMIHWLLLLAGTIGAHTGHHMQFMLLVGAVFPGSLALAVVLVFLGVASTGPKRIAMNDAV